MLLNRKMFQGYMIGLIVGWIMSIAVYLTAHIENGFLFFLACFPCVVGLFWLGLVGLNLQDKEN